MSSEKFTVNMVYVRSTKNTHVYKAEDETAAAITTLYVNKISTTPPEQITVTVEWEK